jgi:hypothetical protein
MLATRRPEPAAATSAEPGETTHHRAA